jgi:hypothetical protein
MRKYKCRPRKPASLVVALSVTAWAGSVVGVATSAAAQPASNAARATAAAAHCHSDVIDAPLPDWARAGFHPPDQPMPHVLGDHGLIVAVLWGWRRALFAPPLRSSNNKILWISDAPLALGSDLHIRAQRVAGAKPVGAPQSRVVIGGPGPSIIDMPTAGCWQFNLKWSGHTDSLDLDYYSHR